MLAHPFLLGAEEDRLGRPSSQRLHQYALEIAAGIEVTIGIRREMRCPERPSPRLDGDLVQSIDGAGDETRHHVPRLVQGDQPALLRTDLDAVAHEHRLRRLRLDGELHIWEPASYFENPADFCADLARLGYSLRIQGTGDAGFSFAISVFSVPMLLDRRVDAFTALGVSTGVGRLGAVAGPLVGGYLIGRQQPPPPEGDDDGEVVEARAAAPKAKRK